MSLSRPTLWSRAAIVAASLLLLTPTVEAIGRNTRSAARPTVRPIARATAAPAPRVALQLSALRVTDGVRMRAVLHAIARDAWPQLVACANGANARGVARVFLTAEGRGMRVTELSGAPVARNAALRQCVRTAVEHIHAPPHETPELTASFELYFDLPAL